jgi:phytol kinase
MIGISMRVLLVAGLLIALMGLLAAAVRRFGLAPEWGRKLLHVAMGSVTLSFPWLIGQPAPVLLLAALSGVWLLAVRLSPRLRIHFGSAVHAVERPSWGEIYFAAGTAVSYLLADGEALYFVLPIALLTFADTAAAIAGTLRSTHRHPIGIHDKSVEGCAAFFAVSCICAAAALCLGTHTLAQTFSVAVQLAFDATALEIIGARGADNLLIPIGTSCQLRLLLNAAPEVPAVHLGLAVMVLMLRLTPRRAEASAP